MVFFYYRVGLDDDFLEKLIISVRTTCIRITLFKFYKKKLCNVFDCIGQVKINLNFKLSKKRLKNVNFELIYNCIQACLKLLYLPVLNTFNK